MARVSATAGRGSHCQYTTRNPPMKLSVLPSGSSMVESTHALGGTVGFRRARSRAPRSLLYVLIEVGNGEIEKRSTSPLGHLLNT